MAKNQEKTKNDIYNYFKSNGYEPVLKSTNGKEVSIPDEAEVIEFQFKVDDVNYGTAALSLDNEGQLKVFYSDKIENSPNTSEHGETTWNDLIPALRQMTFGKTKSFELDDMDNLEYDMAKREHSKKLEEGYYPMGKKASYSDNIPECKIIIKHNRTIEEGEQRYRNIHQIFIENQLGERFLAPTTKPGLARVYARHIAEGGKVNDDKWNHITGLCEEYSKMAGFIRATRNGQFNEDTQRLVTAGTEHYISLRESLHKLAGKRGYNNYFESWAPPLMESEGDEDLSEMFMNSSLDPRIESVIPILNRLNKTISENQEIKQVVELEEWADDIAEGKPDFAAKFKKKIDKHNKAVVKTNKEIGTRVADIGASGKEYNIKTDKEWDKQKGVKEGQWKDIDGASAPPKGAKLQTKTIEPGSAIRVDPKYKEPTVPSTPKDNGMGRIVQGTWQADPKGTVKAPSGDPEGVKEDSSYDPFANDPVADAKHEEQIRAQMRQQLKQGKGTSLKNMNPIDRDQYLKNTNRQWDEKTQRSAPATQQPVVQQGANEDDKGLSRLKELAGGRGMAEADRTVGAAQQRTATLPHQAVKLNPAGMSQSQIDDRMTSVGFIPGTRDHARAGEAYRAANPNIARPVSKPLPRSDIQGTDIDPIFPKVDVHGFGPDSKDLPASNKLVKPIQPQVRGVDEDAGPQQKAVGQLGATAKVSAGGTILGNPERSQKGLRGKLVGGANESVDPLAHIIKLSK